MNPETLKKALLLADGWNMADGTGFASNGTIACPLGTVFGTASLTQAHKDALAAQLVRQVDAKGIPIRFEYSVDLYGAYVGAPFEVNIGGVETSMGAINYKKPVRGPDRTENTITAIVESGVLE